MTDAPASKFSIHDITTKPTGASHDPNDFEHPPPEYPVTIDAKLKWVHLWTFDNSNNSLPITEVREVTIEQRVTYTTFDKSFSEESRTQIDKSGVGAEVGGTYRAISSRGSANIEHSTEITKALQLTVEHTAEFETVITSTVKRTFEVGPNSKLSLYQQHFVAPGVNVKTDALHTNPETLEEPAEINYQASPIRWVEYLDVSYGGKPSEMPAYRVQEVDGKSDDINRNFGGKYVWLLPVYTYNAHKAAVRFDLIIQGKEDKSMKDLAKGAGGKFRYLRAVSDATKDKKIYEVALKRSGSKVKFETGGYGHYDGHSGDINDDRDGDYLYLLWATRVSY